MICSTDFSEGRTWTSLRRILMSLMLSASREGLRSASSRTVVTPAARSRPVLALPMPGTRMQAQIFAHSSSCCSLMPDFADKSLRPFAVWAASSSASVVRMPSFFSLDAAKAVIPSIWESGYVMILDAIKGALNQGASTKGGSGELTEARGPRNDLAHLIRSNFVAAELEKFTGNILNFADAEAKPHQPAAERQ